MKIPAAKLIFIYMDHADEFVKSDVVSLTVYPRNYEPAAVK